MAIIATKSEAKDFTKDRPAAGTYHGVCQSVHDLGMQRSSWQGQEKVNHKIVMVWELVDERIADGEMKGKRKVVSKKYNLSLFEKSELYKDLLSWFGKVGEQIDLEKLVGYNCNLSLVEKDGKDGKKYLNVGGIMPLIKGQEKAKPELPADHVYKWIEKLKGEAVAAPEKKNDKDEYDF